MKKIKLTRGKYAIVDDEDYSLLNRHSWCSYVDNGLEYAMISIGTSNRSIYMQQIIMPGKKGFFPAHINGNTLDNRKSNLEYLSLNIRRHRGRIINKNKTSKYKGVYKGKHGFSASIKFNGVSRSKNFKNEKAAAVWYNEMARGLYGEYAFQNEIDD